MSVPDDLIIYLRNLQSGAAFNQQLFERYIEQLNSIAVNPGLSNEELMTILKLWLSMKIAVNKWISFGVCLVPAQKVSDEVMQLAARWILTHYANQQVSRVGFLLNWLSGLVDHDLADIEALDDFYELFYYLLQFEKYAPFSLKLVYNLTKPEDVTRWRVLELLKVLHLRGSGKRRAEINVLLGLFKSYKPEAVPEYVPALSVHNVFVKVHKTLLARLQAAQERVSSVDRMGREKLCWSVFGKFAKSSNNKNYVPIVPDVEFMTAGSNLYSGVTTQKTCLQFKQIAPLLECGLRGSLQRPANMLSLLTNMAGSILLAMVPTEHQSQLSYNVHHLLCMRILRQDRTHNIDMQADLLQRLADFQNTIQQPVPVVSMFLAKYLPFWNGHDFFEEIMSLIQWVSFETFTELKENILDHLEEIYTTIRPWTRCLIQCALLRLYSNLAFSLRKSTFVFLKSSRPENLRDMLARLATYIDGLCTKTLQVYPDNAVAHLSITWLYQQLCAVDKRTQSTWSVLPPALATLCLASPSAFALDAFAEIVLQYRDIYTAVRQKIGKASIRAQMALTECYKEDFINALWSDEPIQGRESGVVFRNLSDNAITDILNQLSQADMALGVSCHLALAPYTYLNFQAVDDELMDRVAWLDNGVMPNFKSIAAFVREIDASL